MAILYTYQYKGNKPRLKVMWNIDLKAFSDGIERATQFLECLPPWKQEVLEEALINSPWRKGSPQREIPSC